MQPGAVRTGMQGFSNFIHWYGRIHEQLGRYATVRSVLEFIFIKKKNSKAEEDWEKKVSGICFRNSKERDQRSIKFGRENRPGGRTCNAVDTWVLKDLSSRNNFLADRGTAGETIVISNHRIFTK